MAASLVISLPSAGAESAAPVGIVSHVKVVSDRVEDVSSLEAWQQSFLKDGMSDAEKMIAAWRSSVAFVYQDRPPTEQLHDACVHDAIKTFNVYGYGMCCCASSRLEQLARYAGLPARGQSLNDHSVPEIFWDNGWHMLDASLVNYFTRGDGRIASVSDIAQAVQGWLAGHPELRGNRRALTAFQKGGGGSGWKGGPALLADCSWYDAAGWWPARTHGWFSTMQEYDGRGKTPFQFEYGYSQGYEVNIQLRPGERLTRNWFHRGQHIGEGPPPGCMNLRVGEGPMEFLRGFNDRTEGRIGSGTLVYDLPAAELNPPGGVIEVGMPCSYVYLGGRLVMDAGAGVQVLFSDNHGRDWREVAALARSGPQEIDLTPFCRRRYDYRLRVILNGTRVNALRVVHDLQCSQRALPALDVGSNTITFSAGPSEGTVTVEGSTLGGNRFSALNFHPVLDRIEPQLFRPKGDGGSVTFPIETPGDLARLRFGGFYRVRDPRDQWDMQVSFDGGRTFRHVATQTGPHQGICRYDTVADIPPGTRAAQVRWVGRQRNTTCLFLVRIDADYRQPRGGFQPVRITYLWDEAGKERKDVHIARSSEETYAITCAAKPRMKSIVLELAEEFAP